MSNVYQFPTDPSVPKATDRRIPPASETLSRHKWLQQPQKIVLSADLDGALSFIRRYHLFGDELAGLYDTYGVALRHNVDIAETVGLDTELMFKCKHSLGHHFGLINEVTQVNVNYEAKAIPSTKWLMSSDMNQEKMSDFYQRKFNLGLDIYQLYLYGQKLPDSELGLNLLLIADSSYEQFYKYGYDRVNPNPRQHLEAMGMYSLIEYLDRNKGILDPKETCAKFLSKTKTPNPNAPARINTPEGRHRFRMLIEALNEVLGYPPIPASAMPVEFFDYTPLNYARLTFDRSIVPELIDLGFWSNAILFCRKDKGIVFGVTTDKPITEEYPELYSRLSKQIMATA